MNEPDGCVSFDRGWAVLNELDAASAHGVVESLKDVAPDLGHLMVAYGFGASYCRPELSPRDRQLVTLGILTALGAERQIPIHVSAGLNAGLTPSQIIEAITHAAVYCGFPRAIGAALAAKDALSDPSNTQRSINPTLETGSNEPS